MPVLRNVEGMNYAEVEKAIGALGEKVRISSRRFNVYISVVKN